VHGSRAMAPIVFALSTLILGIGVFGLISPARLRSGLSRFRSRAGLAVAVALRLVLGLALWRAAPASRTPMVFQALGVLSMTSALVLPLLGLRRFQAILSWWSRRSTLFVRAWSVLEVALGAFLLWSVH